MVAHGPGQTCASERLLGQQVRRVCTVCGVNTIAFNTMHFRLQLGPKTFDGAGLFPEPRDTVSVNSQPAFRRPLPPSGSRRVIPAPHGTDPDDAPVHHAPAQSIAADGGRLAVHLAALPHHSLPVVVSRAIRRTDASRGGPGAISERSASAAESVVLASIGAHPGADGGSYAHKYADHRLHGPREGNRLTQQQQLQHAIHSANIAMESLSYTALRRGTPAVAAASAPYSGGGVRGVGATSRAVSSSGGGGASKVDDSVRKYVQSSRSESSAAMFSSIYSAIAERERTRMQGSGAAAVKPRASGMSMVDALQLRADSKRYAPSQTQGSAQQLQKHQPYAPYYTGMAAADAAETVTGSIGLMDTLKLKRSPAASSSPDALAAASLQARIAALERENDQLKRLKNGNGGAGGGGGGGDGAGSGSGSGGGGDGVEGNGAGQAVPGAVASADATST